MIGARRRTAAMRSAILALAGLLLSAPVQHALAGGIEADELGYRLLTHFNATSTSDCIGLTHTPLCALETLMACFDRSVDIYYAVGRGHRPPLADPDSYPDPPRLYPGYSGCYRVTGSLIYRPLDVPEYNPLGVQPGDVAITTLSTGGIEGRCYTGAYRDNATGWLLRRGPYGWYVVDHDMRIDYVRDPLLIEPN